MRLLAILLFLLITAVPACKIYYIPPLTWFYFPIAEVSNSSIEVPDRKQLVISNKDTLNQVSVAVLRNPHRMQWQSTVEDEVKDEHFDENEHLAKYLEDQDIFKEVMLINSPSECYQDFIISCSVDCIYDIELDGDMYLINCLTLGIGFLIGWPYQNSSAFYVVEGVFYDNRTGDPAIAAGTLGENYKEWYCDNMYWRPSFYAQYAMEPLFDQLLYDFLTRSGCMAGPNISQERLEP